MANDITKFLALRTALQNERATIEARLKAIATALGETALAVTTANSAAETSDTAPKKRTFSAATKAKMAASQKARWAAKKAKPSTGAVPVAKVDTAPKPRRNKISAQGLANIIAAQKARWAAKNAAN